MKLFFRLDALGEPGSTGCGFFAVEGFGVLFGILDVLFEPGPGFGLHVGVEFVGGVVEGAFEVIGSVDFFVDDKVMVEIKALIRLEDVHLAQAINYLEAYNIEVGLLINFGAASLQFKRLLNKKLSKSGLPK